MKRRACFFPIFVFGVYFQNVRTGVRPGTSPKPSVRFSCIWIEETLVREGELELGIPSRNMLAMRSSRLRETVVQEIPVSASNPVQHSVENTPTVIILV